MRTTFLIDGFNFYHSIENLDKRIRWFDYRKFCNHFLTVNDVTKNIMYYSALAFWKTESAKRHKVLIDAYKTIGIDVILGKFKEKYATCPKCLRQYKRHEEKATDVNIALAAYRTAIRHDSDTIIIVSGDTDLIPAIKMIKSDAPDIKVGIIFPFDRKTKELQQVSDFYHTARKEILPNFRLPDTIIKENGKKITCPPEWM